MEMSIPAPLRKESSRTAAQIEDPCVGVPRGELGEPAAIAQDLGVLNPSALDLSDPHVSQFARHDSLTQPGLPEALDEIVEGRARIRFGQRAGERPVLLVVHRARLRYAQIRYARQGPEHSATGRAVASELALRQISAAVRAFQSSDWIV